ncbi:hypothetical protein A1O3_08223 [Capronia epimyces CBS 606.96]|uniref:Altered inheritance of mitochondria protein 9, mitochondrial n=1 Tax=Capronia epimyces CBS 606.96 TaxID=1182542 RepID=W9XIB1_9EURO|nr:uncharacterized protein A1O3_08223 [Capronia epimyces CBS 606.96]EXJ79938.1 hypothetical protein A1O3_08223 [Capronia epimyces CBS 606.96]
MTSIPVPDVLAWSSDPSNPVGAEYMILEKCPGRQLHTVWGEMDELRRFELVKTIADFDGQLASTEFPVNGSLYLRTFGPQNSVAFNTSKDPQGVFCIGPVFNDSWLGGINSTRETEMEAGPWSDLCAFGLARARQGAWHVKNTEYLGARGPHFGSPDSHLQLLEVAIKFIPVLAATPLLQRYGRPTLWHTDLHMGNMFVSEKDLTKIVSVIDWQFISILPRFTQARWPEFLTPPEGYETGPIEPQLPADFEEMDPDEQAYEVSQKDQALQAKCYEVALGRCHRDSYLALTGIHDTIRRLFVLCERTYKDGIVPLRDCLIELSCNWEQIGLTGRPPLTLSKEELATHEV